jgi:exodeoxyribonuclease V alpha subunit
VLLGDRDQLASVEAGAVLGDLCDTGTEHGFSPALAKTLAELTGERVDPGPGGDPGSSLRDGLAILHWSYRFGASGGIGAVSRSVNAGEADEALRLLREDPSDQVAWRETPPPERLGSALDGRLSEAFRPHLETRDPEEALARFARFRILCARRSGPFGVEEVNRRVEEILARAGLIDPGREWYPGRPVLVTRNDPALRLYNGDVGLTLPDPAAAGALRVFFPAPEGGLRTVAPLRLPTCETVYAMTVHKSQGSEFEELLLLLGAHSSRVLTRELVYTGITRARKNVEVWGAEAVFREAVSRRVERSSGLRDALWASRPPEPP